MLLVRIRAASTAEIFLHLGAGKGQLENTVVFICTALLILIAVAGSLWVMHNANVNIMPTTMSPEQARAHDLPASQRGRAGHPCLACCPQREVLR